ncbi:ATPase domain-containing protein [Methanocella conradii]|uniref:ATPase domain-containing protein n=1 Tax=Methanocella conradii TaxID=1175444 RepID=UPI00157D87C2|nr:ATPase domain-containing protein [Methanocella conradii]
MINRNVKKTGIPTLDDCLMGGIPIGKTLLFYGRPLAESDVFVMQMVYTNLADDEICYYVTSGYSPDVARAAFKEYGWDTSKYSKRFEVVDAYSPLVGASSSERFSVKDPESIESYDEAISSIIDMLSPGDMLTFSSLSALFDQCSCGGEAVLRHARKWNKMAVLRGGIVVYNFVDRGYDPMLVEHVKNGLCNATVQVGGLGEDMIYGHYFKPYSCDWARLPERPTLFKVTRPGGITVHIPKILVTGPQGSGKSTFVRTAAALSAGKYVSVDRMGTTIAGDHAQVTIKGFSMDLFGTPGQKPFIPTLKAFAVDAMGIVVIVDSADPDFDTAAEILSTVRQERVPYIVVANKQDAAGAGDADYIRGELDVPGDVPVMGICASNGQEVQRTLETLIGMMVECPSSSPNEKFDVVISDLKRVQGVRAAAIVSRGGILKSADVPGGVQGEGLAFAASTILNTAEAAAENLGEGKLGRLVVDIDERRLLVMGADERNLLVVLADQGGNIGPVIVEAEEAVKRIKDLQKNS